MSHLVKVQNLKTYFPVTGGLFRRVQGHVKAVNDISIEIQPKQIVSIVGESGCGKSTLGQSILGLVPPTEGKIFFEDQELQIQQPRSWKPFRKDFQIIFQDPYSSLNPRHTVYEILAEPLIVHQLCPKPQIKDRIAELLHKVGLSSDYMHRFPHAFSGGQRQRLNIARAISMSPKMIVCDEVVAALDVSVQAQIIHLLMDLKEELGLSLLFISHDLSLVKMISDWIHVMYLGKIVESASAQSLFSSPKHPYTQALIDSIPTLDRNKKPKLLKGEVPSPMNLPSGCSFHNRCPHAQADCHSKIPILENHQSHHVACLHHESLSQGKESL